MLDDVRALLYRAITTRRGDFFFPFRLQKRIARGINALLGSPLAPREELRARREERAHGGTPSPAAAPSPAPSPSPLRAEPAPVMVYYEKDRNQRELSRIEDTLRARNIRYSLLDVTGDPGTISFVTREARCEDDDLPVVFVAGAAVGCYNELVQWDVSGRLVTAVFGSAQA